MLGWGWGVAGLVVEGENKWEMKNNHVVLPLRRILDNNQQALIISFFRTNSTETSTLFMDRQMNKHLERLLTIFLNQKGQISFYYK